MMTLCPTGSGWVTTPSPVERIVPSSSPRFQYLLSRAPGSEPAAHDAPDGGAAHARSVSRALCWLLLVILFSTIGIEFWSRSLAYENHIEQGAIAGRNVAHASMEHVDASLDRITWMLDGLVERVETDGTAGAAGDRLRQFLLSRIKKQDSPLQGLYVLDRDGNWIVTTAGHAPPGANNADRAYFVYHRTHAEAAAHLGRPVLSRSTGEWIITLSRRINDRQGNFAGVALATIPVQYFQNYNEHMAVGRQGAILLAFSDGTVVARTPMAPGVVGSSVRGTPLFRHVQASATPRGSVMLMTRYDQVERLHSFERSQQYPLFATAALGKQELLAEWRRVTWQEGAAISVMIGAVFLVGLWLIVQMRVRGRLECTLRKAQARLEAQNAALERLAQTDGLTGLFNRRYLDERLSAELARAAREQDELSLIMIDVDFFKRFNDRYGHAAGDDCLRMVARVLAASLKRPADIAARFGGEEFAVLLPNTPLKGALRVAERICAAIQAEGLAHEASELGIVTISAGAASMHPAPHHKVRVLLEAADAALYEAKTAGRNTFRAARDDEREGHVPV